MQPVSAFEVRRDAARGYFTHDWLDVRFSVSFGDWHDPDWPRFGPRWAVDEDRVHPVPPLRCTRTATSKS
jgi:hypothetical protein